MESVPLEREELVENIEEATAVGDTLRAKLHLARVRAEEECQAKISALQDLAKVREELDHERHRLAEETNIRERQREEASERDEAIRCQLVDIINLLQDQRAKCVMAAGLKEERWDERREQIDSKLQELHVMSTKIIEDREMERLANESRPGMERLLEELQKQNAEQREQLNNMSEAWRAESARQHDETIDAVRSTAQEQVPFNIQGYMDEFSKALASEVRILLGEVGKLREERRSLQFELGYLMCMKSKYGPGGEFDPDWKPSTGTGGVVNPFSNQRISSQFQDTRNLRFELGCLLSMKSKYGPCGEFEPNWRPSPGLDVPGGSSADAPSKGLRTVRTSAKSAWRTVTQRIHRKQNRNSSEIYSAPAPVLRHHAHVEPTRGPGLIPGFQTSWLTRLLQLFLPSKLMLPAAPVESALRGPDGDSPAVSWGTWQPDLPSPLSVEPTLCVPADIPRLTMPRPPRPHRAPSLDERPPATDCETWQPDPNMVPSPMSAESIIDPGVSAGLLGPKLSRSREPSLDLKPQVQPWATWQPDPNMAYSPTFDEYVLHPGGDPGLFGPRSPRDSYQGL